MLLIYTHKITPRFSYITKQIFTRILGIDIIATTKIEDFIKHSGAKITYTKQALQNEFFVRSNDLLFEQGINDLEIKVGRWDTIPCFFNAGDRSNIPFDIFSASFYLLSRYEEYLPHVKDNYGRYPYEESIAFTNDFLQKPVVDIWAFKLLDSLKERFPDLEYKQRKYEYTSIIDVTTSHCYKYKGVIRSIAGALLDVASLRFNKPLQRILVLINYKKDPYDNFSELIAKHKDFGIKSMFFFQYADYSTYDKNIPVNNNEFKYLIKSVADYSIVSLAGSYASLSNKELLKEEKKRLSNVINRTVNGIRIRYNKVNIPDSYRDLVAAEFTDDYTMGYRHQIGFRAGTCSPFYFYDISLEVQQSIKVHPLAVNDYALLKYKKKEEIFNKINFLYTEVKNNNGNFITVFSNELLGEKHKINWKEMYYNILKNCNA